MPRKKRKVVEIEANNLDKDQDEESASKGSKERRRNPTRKSKIDISYAAHSASSSSRIARPTKENANDEKLADESSSESDWEEVEENEIDDDGDDDDSDYKCAAREPVIPKEGVEITVEEDGSRARKKRKGFDLDDYLRRQLIKFKREVQESMHKVHLLCLLARGIRANSLINRSIVRAMALSLMPAELLAELGTKKSKRYTLNDLNRVQSWCSSAELFFIGPDALPSDESKVTREILTVESLIENFDGTSKTVSPFRAILIVAVFLRTLDFEVRLVFSLQPIALKLKTAPMAAGQSTANKKPNHAGDQENLDDCAKSKCTKIRKSVGGSETIAPRKKTNKCRDVKNEQKQREGQRKNSEISLSREDVAEDEKLSGAIAKRMSLRQYRRPPKNLKEESDHDDDDDDDYEDGEEDRVDKRVTKKSKGAKKDPKEVDDEDFKVDFVKIDNPGPLKGVKKNRKTLSSDSDEDLKASTANDSKNDCWLEVYLEELKQWVCIDPVHESHLNNPHKMEKSATQPLKYVVAFDDRGHLKDVTKRYASGWLCHTRKIRVDPDWWQETLKPFRGPKTRRDLQEDNEFDKNLEERPLPTSISEFKGHPLYALKRHLLKFEGIYPPDAVPVGFLRGEPIYPRHCIRSLHSRETWLKEAKLVRIGETPYKVVKARPKWNRAMGEMQSDLPLDLFGAWQTEDYIAPPAKDGKVPRNDYGNVELFKPCMLPPGTVHLQIPGLNRVARKLDIDCVQAMTGWDFHGVGSHPIFDGWVVCEEFKDTLLDAWNEEQVIINQKEQEKREKRIYANWRRLIRGLLIRERLQIKYGLHSSSSAETSTKDSSAKTAKRQKKK